ncbi:uncharacterized protein LOC122634559 [Vespula pensylvanica]|uniref:uncharacterized protein LOC122634559 n=1 Tax=Vespula pensylvanica TaxID=30213 RepID=UPI001CBA5D52|nr:uncharacterized protein LOC122634559 [Vespula pensylvanica]
MGTTSEESGTLASVTCEARKYDRGCFAVCKRRSKEINGEKRGGLRGRRNARDVNRQTLIVIPSVERNGEIMKDTSVSKTQEPTDDIIEIKTSAKTKSSKSKSPFEKKEDGFKVIEDNIAILRSNMCLKDSVAIEPSHFKSCYYAAILCLLAKIRMDVNKFRQNNLDEFIYAADKIYQCVGKLRYKLLRWFNNFEILDTKYTVIMKQFQYADPESCESDKFENVMESFLDNNETGILVTTNISYGFWKANDRYYFFNPYGCDEEGKPDEKGYSCLMKFCDLSSMLKRMKENLGKSIQKPYRLYTLFIAHMETKCRKKKKKKKKTKYCIEKIEEEVPIEDSADFDDIKKSESETSLIELTEWVTEERKLDVVHDTTVPGFSPIRYYEASMIDVIVLENEITRPVLAPFKKHIRHGKENTDPYKLIKSMIRKKPYDRKFREHVSVTTPIDLCIIAWSLIHDPVLWSVRTIKGLFDASCDYTFDSILATEDSTVVEMSDGLLPEFEIANYIFRAVFVPLHYGILYAVEGWNLAMSLKYVFESPIYTGAIIVCEGSHIGVTKVNENYFAWWIIKRTKILRIITSACIDEFLRIVVKEIDQPEEIQFVMRVITISYARKLDPDCSDVKGLHEFVVPTTSLAEVHKMEAEPYDLEVIFKPTVPESKPIFINGTVALNDRETVKEPRVKRCYFVAILAVIVKRDIVQSPLPGMIDKMIEVAENLYKGFHEPKFHSEHILRNVTLMNRIFDFRDCASCLVTLTVDPHIDRNDFYLQVKKYLKRHFMMHSSGIIQFTNCCYGFWYSRSTNSYYYLDPYQCNDKGRKVSSNGKACLCIFPSICQMVKNMCFNQIEETTGFFIHRLHVESVNASPFIDFQEDPIWIYLDYHWTFDHAPKIVKIDKKGLKKRYKRKRYDKEEEEERKPMRSYWNNYVIEVNDLIYSIWGTIGCYDSRFGNRAGKNQAAISVAVLAMQYLSHPSRWNSAVLDSAVICGDSYYTESLKSSIKRCSKYLNKYNLQPCFKIFPHVWTINYQKSICGILYGGRNRLTLADALKSAFNDAPNVLIECNKIMLGALLSKDGYYVADPCWIGPPLFGKDRGAIYVLRCKNFHSFVYAVTKMLNTNQRLEFRITPVTFIFEQENFKLSNSKGYSLKRKVLLEPIHTTPGKVEGYDVSIPGGQTVADADSYLCYNRNVNLGIVKGNELENPQLPSLAPRLKKENLNSMLVSTMWHLNLGQNAHISKPYPIFDPTIFEHIPEKCEDSMVDTFEARHYPESSINDILNFCDDYPTEIDFMSHLDISTTSADTLMISRPLECSQSRRFIRDQTSLEFDKLTVDMTDEIYKTYQHRLPQRIVEDIKDEDLEVDPTYAEETIHPEDEEPDAVKEIGPVEETEPGEETEPVEETESPEEIEPTDDEEITEATTDEVTTDDE